VTRGPSGMVPDFSSSASPSRRMTTIEHAGRSPVLVIRVRHTRDRAVRREHRVRHDQRIRLRQRPRTEKRRLHNGEHRRRRANAQRKRQNGDRRERTRAPERAQREPHVLPNRLDHESGARAWHAPRLRPRANRRHQKLRREARNRGRRPQHAPPPIILVARNERLTHRCAEPATNPGREETHEQAKPQRHGPLSEATHGATAPGRRSRASATTRASRFASAFAT
jgi:hypothetical protein